MLEALEKDLCLDINEKSQKKILDIFELAKAVQLPVVEGDKVVGILDLFDYLYNKNRNLSVSDMMEKDITVAGEEQGIFSFKNSKQQILPFVDEGGNYLGFVNKLFQKCYLPSKEYMQVIERSISAIADTKEENADYEAIKDSFDAVFESNYDGIYITVDKGITWSINDNCDYVKGFDSESVSMDEDKSNLHIAGSMHENEKVNLIQNIQKRKEVSISEEIVSDGGLVRIINDIDNFEQIKNELTETQKLSEKYQTELEFLRWEQTKPDNIIAKSPEMKKIVNLAVHIAKVDSTVLIQGQSGVGKGVLSKLIHNSSPLKDGPFIKIDCSSIPENLLESELFGYESGSFTGADKGGKTGLIELADGGTLFLDEIGEIPLNLQAKLLRVLQDKEIHRIGGSNPISVDLRIIAATNRDLEELVKLKKFRKDLYYRLKVVPITIPPLAERKEDIRPLIEECLASFNEKYGLSKKIDPRALRSLIDFNWPGNVRELENTIEYLVVTTSTDLIERENLPENILEQDPVTAFKAFSLDSISSLKEATELLEKKLLLETMEQSTSTSEMADLLKVDRSTVVRKLQKYKMKTHF